MPDAVPDVLGHGFEAFTLPMRDDREGKVVVTLVRKRCLPPSRVAVLHIHGFVDYFFHVEMADAYLAHGINVYAIDLRKYGRSLLPHQTPNFCTTLDEYFEDLDAAIELITQRDGNTVLLLSGHSTVGLIAAMYAHHMRAHNTIQGIFLNSPFFDLNASWFSKHVLSEVVSGVGRISPYRQISTGMPRWYAMSIHKDYHGHWDYYLPWKPVAGFPVRAGWLRAIHRAQQQLQAGLAISCPILVMSSTQSSTPKVWDDILLRTDSVLDVEDIRRYAHGLGDHVTLVRIPGGMHDLTLSAPSVRAQVYRELLLWTSAYVCPRSETR